MTVFQNPVETHKKDYSLLPLLAAAPQVGEKIAFKVHVKPAPALTKARFPSPTYTQSFLNEACQVIVSSNRLPLSEVMVGPQVGGSVRLCMAPVPGIGGSMRVRV